MDALITWLVGNSSSISDPEFMARLFALLCSCYLFGAAFSQLGRFGR